MMDIYEWERNALMNKWQKEIDNAVMGKIIISTLKGDSENDIDLLINFLQEAKINGATHFLMRWSNDPMWAFKWFETFRVETYDEIKEKRIKDLEEQLKALKNG